MSSTTPGWYPDPDPAATGRAAALVRRRRMDRARLGAGRRGRPSTSSRRCTRRPPPRLRSTRSPRRLRDAPSGPRPTQRLGPTRRTARPRPTQRPRPRPRSTGSAGTRDHAGTHRPSGRVRRRSRRSPGLHHRRGLAVHGGASRRCPARSGTRSDRPDLDLARGRNQLTYNGVLCGAISLVINPFLLFSIMAIVWSVRGRKRADEFQRQGYPPLGRGQGTAGLMLGIIGTVLGASSSSRGSASSA